MATPTPPLPPFLYHPHPFQGYPLCLANSPLQVTQLLEGPTPPPPPPRLIKGVGGSNYESFHIVAIIFCGFQDS